MEFASATLRLATKAAVPSVFLTVRYKRGKAWAATPRTFNVDQPAVELDSGQVKSAVQAENAADPGALAGTWRGTVKRTRLMRDPLPGEPALLTVDLRRKAGRVVLVVTSENVNAQGEGASLWRWSADLPRPRQVGRWDDATGTGTAASCRDAMLAAWREARRLWGDVCQVDGLQAGGRRRVEGARQRADLATAPAPKAAPAAPAPRAAPAAPAATTTAAKAGSTGRKTTPRGGQAPAPTMTAPIWGTGWSRWDREYLDRLWSYLTEARRLKREAPGVMLGSGAAVEAGEYIVARAETGQAADGRMGTSIEAVRNATEDLRMKIERARVELDLPPFTP